MEQRSGLVPYLFYDDVAAMIDWYKRIFGFVERARYTDEDGALETPRWLSAARIVDGREPPAGWEAKAVLWIGVWVDDPDKMYEKIRAHGVEIDPPEDKPYGVRSAGTVRDPEGYSWGFMRRLSD